MAHVGLWIFHIPPSVFLDEDYNLIMDVIRYHNLKDGVKDSGQKFYDDDIYEDQDFEQDIKPITL
jgi:hypothetical protein